MTTWTWDTVAQHSVVGVPYAVGTVTTVLLFGMLVFFFFTSLPEETLKKLKIPLMHTAEKRSIIFVFQILTIVFGLCSSITLNLSFLLRRTSATDDDSCKSIESAFLFFGLGIEFTDSVFLIERARLTEFTWKPKFKKLFNVLFGYVLLSYPALILAIVMTNESFWYVSDMKDFGICGLQPSAVLIGLFFINVCVVNACLFVAFYVPIRLISSTVQPTATSMSSPDTIEALQAVMRRNFIAFCIIIVSLVIQMLVGVAPPNDIGILLSGYIHVHSLVKNLGSLYCTKNSWTRVIPKSGRGASKTSGTSGPLDAPIAVRTKSAPPDQVQSL